MGKPTNGTFRAPQSIEQLTKGMGWNSELVGFLIPYARRDYVYIEDDFLNDTLDATIWDQDTDTGSTPYAIGTLECGNIQGVTQNSTGDYIGIHSSIPIFDAARKPGAEIRFKIVTYTAAQLVIEFGLSDDPTDGTLQSVNNIDTPTTGNGVTDFLGIAMDGGKTLKTFALVGDGTTPAASKADFPATIIPTADTWMRMLVQVGGSSTATNLAGGIGMIRNEATAAGTTDLSKPGWARASVLTGPTTGYLMQMNFLIGTLADTARTVDIDYIRIWSERSPNA